MIRQRPRQKARETLGPRHLNRRRFIELTGLGLGAAALSPALLAACGGGSDDSAGELPIGTPQKPVRLPVEREPIADGLAPESGTLRIYDYADYLNPDTIARFESTYGVKVETSTFATEEEALIKLRSGAVDVDLAIGLTDLSIAPLVAAGLLQPLNRSYLSNFTNLIAGLQDPYYDLGSQGELNRSSQHLMTMEVCGGASAAVGRQGASPGDAVAGEADPGSSCGARVLASDRSGQEHRGRCSRDRGVGPSRVALVPSRWRDATCEPRRTDRPVSVVR